MTVTTTAKPTLKTSGFRKSVESIRHRLICAVDGKEKQGKTHFALTAPAPVAVQSTDIGLEGVVQKFQQEKEILMADYRIDIRGLEGDPKKVASLAEAAWKRFVNDYHAALNDKVRTIIWDTATEAWELLRLAEFGKLTQVMPHHYGPVNAQFRALIRDAYDSNSNLIMLHKLKPEWMDGADGKGKKTGRYVRSGFADTGFMVQINATTFREDGIFNLRVDDCRQNAELAGAILEPPMNTFPMLAMQVFPDSDLEEWL